MEENQINVIGAIKQSVFTIIAINDQAHSLAIELVAHIKKTPLYKQQIEQLVGLIEKDIKDYYKVTMNDWKDPEYYSEICEYIADELREDYATLENAIINFLSSKGTENPELLAKIEVARCIAIGAVNTYDKMSGYINRVISVNFSNFRLTALAKNLDRLCNMLFKNQPYADLNKDENCMTALRTIINKLSKGEIYVKAMENLEAEKVS